MQNLKPIKYVFSTLSEVTSHIDPHQPVAFDIETIGLYGKVALAQFYQSHWDSAMLVKSPEILELAMTIRRWHLVMHNASYEVSTIQDQMGYELDAHRLPWVPERWDDTLLLSKLHFYTKESFSLDDCYSYVFGYDIYSAAGIDKKEMQKAKWTSINPEQATYGAMDVFYLLDLYDQVKGHTDDISYQLDKSATSAAFAFQVNGLPISHERIESQMADNNRKIAELAVPINVNSWQQVRPYIGEDESDGLALATFALEGNERAAKVRQARKLIKENSFLQKYLDESFRGRIFGKFSFTTKSGRGNCKDQNLQQLPRTTKGVFEAGPGKVLVMSDFAQLELRMICALSGEPAMEKLFKEGVDLHGYTVEMMNVPRQQAKTCNFNLTYGGSANMLRSIFISDVDLLLSIGEVTTLKKKWHNLWRTLTAWQERKTAEWRAGAVFETVLGRRMKAKLYTDAMNLPVQGSSAEVAKLAMHKMFKAVAEVPELVEVTKFINFVHDSFMWECPDDPAIYEPLALITANAMKDAWHEIVTHTKIPDLPMPVDVTVGKNWGDLEYEIETPIYSITI